MTLAVKMDTTAACRGYPIACQSWTYYEMFVVDIDRFYSNLLLLTTCDMSFYDAAICTDRTLQLGLLRQ